MSNHDHPHSHPHPHDRDHNHRAPNGGPVVFDIGGDVGAMIMYVDEVWEGSEIPIEWNRDPAKDVHTGVWRRSLGNDSVVVAVYPELIEGRYRVPALGAVPARDVDIVGGEVAEIDLRSHHPSNAGDTISR